VTDAANAEVEAHRNALDLLIKRLRLTLKSWMNSTTRWLA